MSEAEIAVQKFGTFLTASGAIGFFIGTITGFHRPILLISNFLFFTGIFFTLGINKTKKLFFDQKRIVTSLIFCFGILLTTFNHGFWGSVLEMIASFQLFGGFFRQLYSKIQNLLMKDETLPI